MKNRFLSSRDRTTRPDGFSLIELLVVMVIIGIMATAIIREFTGAKSRLKGCAFSVRTDINLARTEAVNRNQDILIEFIFDTEDFDGDGDMDNGYKIYVDTDSSLTINPAVDDKIKEFPLPDDMLFYKSTYPGGATDLIDNSTPYAGDGVTFSTINNVLVMQANGACSEAGTIYICLPDNPGAPADMQTGSYAVDLNTLGRIQILVWDGSSWIQ